MQRYTPGSGESVVLSMPGSERTGLSLEHLRVVEAVSPTVDAVRTEGGVEITVKDLRGTQTVPLLDGTTPTISASEIPGGHRLTITGAEGTQTLDIMDGADGRGISGATLNSDYTLTITYTDGTTYTTPSLRGPQGDPGHTPVKGVDYFDGEPGISPSITITNITGGHRVTITDADGTRAFDVLDGTDGDDGRGIASAALNSDYTLTITYTDGTAYTTPSLRGEPGENGISPVASVSKTGKVATITITDKNGTTTATVSDGEDGTPGISPTVTVTDITGGHRITITDADGAHSFDVMDGDAADAPVQSVNGQTGAVVLDAADVGAGTYSKPSGGIPASDLAAGVIPTVPVQDVQINGSSVLSSGVANVPIADSSNLGVVKAGASTAISGSGSIEFRAVGAGEVKAGTSYIRALTPERQHASVFYGLAKAAGSDMASSSNAIGQYTDAAKVAIQKMLGINETFDLLETINLTDTGSDIATIRNSDMQGIAYAYDAFVVDVETSQSATLVCGVFAGASDARTKLVSYNRASKKRFRLYVFGLGSGLWWAIGMDDSGTIGSITPTSSYPPITNATDKISYVSAELKTGFESATIKLFGMKK